MIMLERALMAAVCLCLGFAMAVLAAGSPPV